MNGLTIKDRTFYKGDIPINIIGLDKGEKLHEKLSYKTTFLNTTSNKILLCDENFNNLNFITKIKNLLKNINTWSNKKIKNKAIEIANT